MKNPVESIAFAGEQVISFLDELTKLPCPKCHEQNLNPTIVGQSLIVRCSEYLQEYNALESVESPVLSQVCDYIQVIKRTSIHKAPFTFDFKEGRATKANIPKAKGTPGRPRKRAQ